MIRDDDALDALRAAADRPRPLTDEARRRVEARMLVAYEQARTEHPRQPVDAPGPVIDLEAARAERPRRPRHHRLYAAAAVMLAIALVAAVSLRDDSDDRVVDVAGIENAGMDPDVVGAVRRWCRADLAGLRGALDALDGGATDARRRVVLDTLATTADGLFDVLSDLQIADGARRLQEVGRLAGESAVLRDGDQEVTAADVDHLAARLDAELVLLSDAGPACEVRR